MKNLRFSIIALVVAYLAACGGGKPPQSGNAPQMSMPQSISPALIKPEPMAKTAILPRSAMGSPRTTKGDIQGLSWTTIPGSASQVSASTDGSLWALSTQPAGPDKYIWHYAGGAWTNISGLASQLAVAPAGTLYAINSGGGTYSYSAGTWTPLGGGASALTAAADGSTYVLSNGGPGPDRAIWHNVAGVWSQVPGSGVSISASWDSGNYNPPAGSVSSGGLYILNSIGDIYYENPGGTFAHMSGSASAITPTTSGGTFVLGYPTNPSGNTIYYYNLATGTWTAEPGAGVGISTDGTHLYVVGASGGIYSSPVTAAATPTPTPTPTPSQNLPQLATVAGSAAWVNSAGFTLYQFTADGVNVSNCTLATYSGCSGTWPPLVAPASAVATGDFTPFTRPDGSKQWSYLGHPLYTFSGDSAPYGFAGNGLTEPDGTKWSVARPPSTSPTPDPTAPPCRDPTYC